MVEDVEMIEEESDPVRFGAEESITSEE